MDFMVNWSGTLDLSICRPLRLPQARNVLVKTLTRMQWYFLEIFPLFIIASVLLWAGKLTGALDWLVRAMTPSYNFV